MATDPSTASGRASPRRGFTFVGDVTPVGGPVVVRVDGSHESIHALRAAAGQAMSRICELVVIDQMTPHMFETNHDDLTTLDEREQEGIQAILRNSNVRVQTVDEPPLTLEDIAHHCRRVEASLLVLNPIEVELLAGTPALLEQILTAGFDLLMITESVPTRSVEDQESPVSAVSSPDIRRVTPD